MDNPFGSSYDYASLAYLIIKKIFYEFGGKMIISN